MKCELKKEFPQWVNNNEIGEFDLCLSDDLDSLFSCILLEEIKGYKINYFYNFYGLGEITRTKNFAIAVDVDLVQGKCWGNHTVLLSNHDKVNAECANINSILGISRSNYTKKFCGSTLLQIISYYDYDISNLSDEALLILLAIDSTYLSYYFNEETCRYYLVELLELDRLYEILEKYPKQEFERVNRQYKLKSKIEIKDGRLVTNIDLKGLEKLFNVPFLLPKESFELVKEFKYCTKIFERNDFSVSKSDLENEIFSLAVTNKNFCCYSI